MKTYDDVREAFDSQSVLIATKQELEELLLAVGRARIEHPTNQARAAEMGETMRQLLAARQSEALHGQALQTAQVALWVSIAALVASLVQAIVALNVVAPLGQSFITLPGQTTQTAAPSTASKPASK